MAGSTVEDAASVLEVAFGRNAKAHALRVLLPPPDATGASYRLLFTSSGASLGPNAHGLLCDRSGAVGGKKLKAAKREREAVAGTSSNGSGAGNDQMPGMKKKKKKKRPEMGV